MLPERIDEMLLLANWRGLEREIRAGFPVNVQAYGGSALFELVLSAHEHAPRGPSDLPMSLLHAMVQAGLPRGEIVPGRAVCAVVLCAEYAQWEWMQHLIELGFQVETPEWPALPLVVIGRGERYAAMVDDMVEQAQEDNEQAPAKVRLLHPQERPDVVQQATHIAYAARARQQQELAGAIMGMDLLLAAGASIDAVPLSFQPPAEIVPEGVKPGANALVEAQRQGDEGMALALVSRGADVASVRAVWLSPEAATIVSPLMYAVNDASPRMVEALLDAGAKLKPDLDTKVHDVVGYHPLRAAVAIKDEEDRSAVMKAMLARMSADEIAQHGVLAMQQAASHNRVDYMDVLFNAGVSLVARTQPNGFMPIHQACSAGSAEAIEYLLVHGATLADVSSTGVSAASLLMKHPELLARFDGTPDVGNVRVFRPRR